VSGDANNSGTGPSKLPGSVPEVLERDLVIRAKAGDRAAFKALAERYYRRVYRMLLAMTRNEDTALDLTQDTFVRALQALPAFNLSSAFYTWLYRIAMNAALDRMRRAKTAGVHEEYDDHLDHDGAEAAYAGPSYATEEPSRLVATREQLAAVQAALEMLRPEHRQIVVLREFEDMSYEEISAVLGIKMGTVMSRLFAARMKLREILETKFGMKG
jgi:RNA polymerase sigma-70 factor (ECF subfamily)